MDKVLKEAIDWTKVDPDFDAIRDHPRFVAMIARADARLARGAMEAHT
jgi:hypothetical protein